MRCIGIIGAMEVEVASLKEQMKDIQVTRKASMEFYSGIIEGKNVVVVRSGIGKVNAAVCTQILIHHDMNAVAFGYPVGQIPQMEAFSFHSDDALRTLAVKACKEANPDIEVFEGRIASGDQFVADQGVKDFITKEFGAYAVEMEGAAIAQAAYLNNVPFLVIRAISDKADGSAEMDYPTFEAQAAEHSFKLTLRILKDIQG